MLTLTRDELVELTGGLRQPAAQLRELHRQGFFRARRSSVTGHVVVELAHIEAVRAGASAERPFDYSTIIPRPAFNAQSAKRAAAIAQRTPKWADIEAIEAVYASCREVSATTGVQHHVDHEIPLQGRNVSGLHVHNNLRILTAAENVKKHNRFELE